MWIGYVQPVHHTPTLPIGAVQEAARCQAFTGGYDRIQPMCRKVRGNDCLFKSHTPLVLGADFSYHTVNIVQHIKCSFVCASRGLLEILEVYEDNVIESLYENFKVCVL